MTVNCVWEHNGNDTLLWAVDFVGAFTRGETKEIALNKMSKEIKSYAMWANIDTPAIDSIVVIQDAPSGLQISDADSDVIFENEMTPLTMSAYLRLKALALKSATDFLTLYSLVPDKNTSKIKTRKTFYGQLPCTAEQIYQHTKNVNEYYFGELGVEADNDGDIFECRRRGFEMLEEQSNFLSNPVIEGSYGEIWSLRKMLRRFIWHDRIHAKAMYKMAVEIWGNDRVQDVFGFDRLI